MAKCNCNGQVCACRYQAGDGIVITGSGAANDPVVIAAEGGSGGESGWAAGDLKLHAGATYTGGWLICNGQAVSRTAYADLFDAIGTVYGAGNGTTTFNVPDMRDRVPLGASGTKPLGSGGGVESVTLSAFNLPPHTHSIAHNHESFDSGSDGAHKHSLDLSHADGTNNDRVRTGAGHDADNNGAVATSGAHTHAINVPNYTGTSGDGPGASTAVTVMQPYRAMNWLIKT